MSMSSKEREGPVGGVGGSLFTGEAVLGVLGDDRLRPLNRRPSLPPRPLDALLKESTCAQHRSPLLQPVKSAPLMGAAQPVPNDSQHWHATVLLVGTCLPQYSAVHSGIGRDEALLQVGQAGA